MRQVRYETDSVHEKHILRSLEFTFFKFSS